MKEEKNKEYYKTPDYTRRAISNYQQKFDAMSVRMPKGYKDKIKAASSEIGESATGYVLSLITKDLKKRGLLENDGKIDNFDIPF